MLIGGLVCLLTACGRPTPEAEGPAPPSLAQGGAILIWLTLPQDAPAWQVERFHQLARNSIREFKKLYPNVDVAYDLIPDEELVPRFIKESRKGLGPDLAGVSIEAVPELIKADRLTVLTPFRPDLSQFYPALLRQVYIGDKLYALPSYLQPRALCYNRAKLVTSPATLGEMVTLARKGHSMGINSNFPELKWTLGAFGIRLLNPQGNVIVPSRKALLPWFQWLQQVQSEPNMIFSQDGEELFSAFLEGRLAAVTCPSGWIPVFKKQLGSKKFGVSLLPSGPGGPATPYIGTTLFVFNRASSDQQIQLALLFARFLTNATQQKNNVIQYDSVLPSNRYANLPRGLYPILDALITQALTSVGVGLSTIGLEKSLDTFSAKLYQQMIGGEISPAEAAARFEDFIKREYAAQQP